MIKNNFNGTCSDKEHRSPRKNLAKKIAAVLIACIALNMNAQVSNGEGHPTASSVVESIKKELPVETPLSGTIVSVRTPSAPLTVTADLGDVPEQNMRTYAQAPDLFKSAIMGNFRDMGEPLVSLAEAAFNAGIPFALHVVSTTFPEGFTVTFNSEDLKKGLSIEPSDK